MLLCSNQLLIAALNKFNRCAEVRDITCRQIKDDRLDLETNALRSGYVPKYCVKSIACSSEGDDDPDGPVVGRTGDDCGDILPNLVAKRIFDRFAASPREDAHTAVIPILRRHAIKMHMVWIAEGIFPVFFNLP